MDPLDDRLRELPDHVSSKLVCKEVDLSEIINMRAEQVLRDLLDLLPSNLS